MKVVVIGAGVIGCAVAYELAVRGAAVEVVDQRPIAAGATHASAGMLAPYSEGHDGALLSLGLSSLQRYDGFVDRLRHDSQLPFEYERTGTLQVAVPVRNISPGRLVVEGRATFRGAGRTEAPSGWRRVFINKDSLETLEFSSLGTQANDFQVELREGNR